MVKADAENVLIPIQTFRSRFQWRRKVPDSCILHPSGRCSWDFHQPFKITTLTLYPVAFEHSSAAAPPSMTTPNFLKGQGSIHNHCLDCIHDYIISSSASWQWRQCQINDLEPSGIPSSWNRLCQAVFAYLWHAMGLQKLFNVLKFGNDPIHSHYTAIVLVT